MAMELVERIYKLTEFFPKKEQYRLTDQLCRAAISVPSNIAEGSMRHTTKEYIRFVAMAQGSIAEIETQLMLAMRLRYCEQNLSLETLQFARRIGMMLTSLMGALYRKIERESFTNHEPPVTSHA